MTLIRHEGQLQVTCDACPLTYRRTYAEEDFKILVEDIKADLARGLEAARAAHRAR